MGLWARKNSASPPAEPWELGLAGLGVPVPPGPLQDLSRDLGTSQDGAPHLPHVQPCSQSTGGFGFPVWNPGIASVGSTPCRAGPCSPHRPFIMGKEVLCSPAHCADPLSCGEGGSAQLFSPHRPFMVWGWRFCPAARAAPEIQHTGNETWGLIPAREHLGTLSLGGPELTHSSGKSLLDLLQIYCRFIADLLSGRITGVPTRAVGAADGPSALFASQRDPRRAPNPCLSRGVLRAGVTLGWGGSDSDAHTPGKKINKKSTKSNQNQNQN